MSAFRVAVKESVFEGTSLRNEEYGEDPELAFDSEEEAREWVADADELLSGPGTLTLHTAHPNDSSGVDAYLVFKPGGVWTVDPE